MFEVVCTILLAVGLDRFLPERLRADPFVWYRAWAESIERRFNGRSRSHGIVAAVVALIPVVLLVLVLRYIFGELGWVLRFAFDVIVLSWCLDLYRLADRAQEVSESLQAGDMPVANENLRLLAGGDADELTEASIARAAVETVLKQGNSVVIAPLFWFIVLGPVGAVLQRLTRVLDRLWGYRSERLAEFGWAAARLDDILGWIPARVTALSYAIMGSFEDALRCWRYQVGVWSDSNSGLLLASGFGAMQMQSCEGLSESDDQGTRVAMTAVVPDAGHVHRVVALLRRVLLFWFAVAVLILVFGVFRT